MPKTKISEFSATPANNTDIDSINIAEGCAPSGINDAIRELMSQLKDFQTGAQGDSFNGPIGSTTPAAGVFTTLSASSTATLSGLTASTALALDASKNIVSVTNTGTGSNVLATSPTLVTPILGTPTSATLTNATGLPIATGVSGLGTGVATFLATPSSANLAAALTDETGSGANVFATSPTLVTPVLGVATGTSFQGIIGNVTPAAGSFTTLGASSTATLNTLSSSGATLTGGTINGMTIGATTATTGAFTSLTASTTLGVTGVSTLTGGAVVQGLTVGLGAGAVSTNTAVGNSAISVNSVGIQLTSIGYQSLLANTGSYNTAVGYQSGLSNVSGTFNIFIGRVSGNFTTGSSNTMVGDGAGYFVTSGTLNTFLGANAGPNAASFSTGSYNVGLGAQTLYNNTTASSNTAVGYQAGYTNSTGTENIFVGYQAGRSSTNIKNCMVGPYAGYNSTGFQNTFVGGRSGTGSSGEAMTTGNSNTIIGAYTGNQGSLDIRTASNYIVLSDGDGNPRGIFDGSGNFRIGLVSVAYNAERLTVYKSGNAEAAAFINDAGANNYTVAISNRATTGDNKFVVFATESSDTTRGSIVYNRGTGLVTYATTSDYRAKDIIGPVADSGAVIDSVPVYMGKMKGATQERPMFIAHETPAYAHIGEKDAVDEDGSPVFQQMDASSLIPVMWAEIQSLRARVAQLETKGA